MKNNYIKVIKTFLIHCELSVIETNHHSQNIKIKVSSIKKNKSKIYFFKTIKKIKIS